MEKTIENLKLLIKAGRGLIPAEKAITGGVLVNVMTSEVYPADVAIYKDTIVAVGDIHDYIGEETEIIDAKGKYLVPGLIDGHIHSECSKLSITSYAKAVVPHGTTSMISGLDEYISVAGIKGLKEVFAEVKQTPLKVFWGLHIKHHIHSLNLLFHVISMKKFIVKCKNGRNVMEYGKLYVRQFKNLIMIL